MKEFQAWFKKLPMPLKIVIFGFTVYMLYTAYNKIFDKNSAKQGLWGKLTGSSSGSNVALNNTAGANYISTKYPKGIVNLIDLIHEKLSGANLYVYPEVVNRLANLTVPDLKLAAGYWGEKYKDGESKNLYQFINAEWHDGMYNPALGALKKTGYYGK